MLFTRQLDSEYWIQKTYFLRGLRARACKTTPVGVYSCQEEAMEKIIYHESDHVIVKPEYGLGKTYNDEELKADDPRIR